MRKLFCFVQQLKAIYRPGFHTVVVWGTRQYAWSVSNTLALAGIQTDYFGDNVWHPGETYSGKQVLSFAQAVCMPNLFLVIGSWWFGDVFEQFSRAGVKEIHALIDTVRVPAQQYWAERRGALAPYFEPSADDASAGVAPQASALEYTDAANARTRGTLLVQMYGNIGDIVIKAGILRRLVEAYGERAAFLVESRENGAITQLVRLFTPRVYEIDIARFGQDSAYRLSLLHTLNAQRFSTCVSLTHLRLHTTRCCINGWNLNAAAFYQERSTRMNRYLLRRESRFIARFLAPGTDVSPKGVLEPLLKQVRLACRLPARFAAVSLGASDPVRCYAPEKFAPVLDFIRRAGFQVLLLGSGARDEAYAAALLRHAENPQGVVNLVSRLELAQSLSVLAHSAFFVGTESGLWNASYVLDVPSVVIYGGGNYGIFQHRDEKITYVTAKDHTCFRCNWWCTRKTGDGRAYCIDGIPPADIIQGVDHVIKTWTGGERR